jgi:hypothetical protein
MAQVAAKKARADFYQDQLEECKRVASALHSAAHEKKLLTPAAAWDHLRACGLVLRFPRFTQVAYALLCILASSASVERGFSAHGTLKSKLRNRLHSATVDSCLRVQSLVDVPAAKADVTDAIKVFTANPLHSSTHPLLLGRFFEAIGLAASSNGNLPEQLVHGVDVHEIVDAMDEDGAAGSDAEDEEDCSVCTVDDVDGNGAGLDEDDLQALEQGVVPGLPPEMAELL